MFCDEVFQRGAAIRQAPLQDESVEIVRYIRFVDH
jgi:hypothetical protein